MEKKELTIIAAVSLNNVIGNKNKISANVYFIPYLKESSHDKEQILKNVKLILDKLKLLKKI